MREGNLKDRKAAKLGKCIIAASQQDCNNVNTVFLRSEAVAAIYFTARFVRLLFEGGIYFFGKPGDINNSWIR